MTKRSKIPISIVVPVKNEEANLARCLERLSRFSEVIVVDSSSTDKTPQIVEDFGARYINFEWNGQYPKKRNWLLLNHELANEWVLFLDADEFLDDTFCDAVAETIKSTNHNGFWLNYSNFFLGKHLKHGLPQKKLAMFKVGRGLYERIDENDWSRLDMEIHEHPIIDGTIGEIDVRIEHNDDRGISKFIDRHRSYATWEAKRFHLLNSHRSEKGGLTARQKFKYKNISKWWYPWFYFVGQYFGKLGLLDGIPGFLYAFYKAWYFLTIRLLIKEQTALSQAPNTTSFARIRSTS